MPTTTPVDPGLAERKLFVATTLAGQHADGLEQLERDLESPAQRGQVDDLTQLAAVLYDELRELELI